jgi:phosphatidylserine/phosphatidylglycerophosphate/cardiolipin synthase-like enzyme
MMSRVRRTRAELYMVGLIERAGSYARDLEDEENATVKYFKSGKFHAKFMIIDTTLASTGSANFSDGMAENEESLLVTNNSEIILQMISSFEHLWSQQLAQ